MHIVIQGAGRGLGLAFAHHALRAGATNLYSPPAIHKIAKAFVSYNHQNMSNGLTWIF